MSASSKPFTVAGGAAREGAAVVLDKFTGRTDAGAGSNAAAGTTRPAGTP